MACEGLVQGECAALVQGWCLESAGVCKVGGRRVKGVCRFVQERCRECVGLERGVCRVGVGRVLGWCRECAESVQGVCSIGEGLVQGRCRVI